MSDFDFRVRITGFDDDEKAAGDILEKYGPDFDAPAGEFQTSTRTGGVLIELKNVALGDIEGLVQDICEEYDVTDYQVQRRSGDSWFSVEIDDGPEPA